MEKLVALAAALRVKGLKVLMERLIVGIAIIRHLENIRQTKSLTSPSNCGGGCFLRDDAVE